MSAKFAEEHNVLVSIVFTRLTCDAKTYGTTAALQYPTPRVARGIIRFATAYVSISANCRVFFNPLCVQHGGGGLNFRYKGIYRRSAGRGTLLRPPSL